MVALGGGEQKFPSRLGRYELIGRIASGGMASVHIGRITGKAGFARTVAIKVLHRHLASDPEFVAMFLDEARLAARIRHPNVVDVYDVDAVDGELMIVMEYVEGMALHGMLVAAETESRLLPVGLSLRVVHETLLGLHAAHQLLDDRGDPIGLIHRDVSPHNILVGTDGITRVTDFGVAKAAGRIATTRGDALKGKLRYLAPEQLTRSPIDRRVDVFAAGIVLWECLAGRRLFDGETEAAALQMILSGPIPPPSVHRPEVDPEIDWVCLQALSRNPSDRFATAGEFADALEEAAGEAFLRTREVGQLVLATMRHRRAEGAAVASAGAVEEQKEARVELGEGGMGVDDQVTLFDSLASPFPGDPEGERERIGSESYALRLKRARRPLLSPRTSIALAALIATGTAAALIGSYAGSEEAPINARPPVQAAHAPRDPPEPRPPPPPVTTVGSISPPAEQEPEAIDAPAAGPPPSGDAPGGVRPAGAPAHGKGAPLPPRGRPAAPRANTPYIPDQL